MKKKSLRPKAVLFDMDGVIVDSMPYHFIAWYEVLRTRGVRVSCIDVYEREGENWEKSMKDFMKDSGVIISKSEMKQIFIDRQKTFKKYFKLFIFKDVEDLLACLKKRGYVLGLVTGTPMKEMLHILPTKIRKMFDCIVTGDQVKKGKPHPDPYIKAAGLIKICPEECLVIENAPLGIRAAKSAGMFCIAVASSLPGDYLKNADVIVNRISEIASIID